VTPFKLGLSDAPRTVTFTYFPYSAGWSTMYPNWQPEFLESVENSLKAEQHMPLPLRLMMKVPGLNTLSAKLMRKVQLRSVQVEAKLETLSEMIRRTGVDRIDLLKIDVERAEWDVLNGLEEQHWPLVRQMVVEVQIDHDPDNANRIRKSLEEHGFAVHDQKSNYLFGAKGEHLNSTLYAVRRPA
jgi:FkbM family methyltransferase